MSKHVMRITAYFLCISPQLGFWVMHIIAGLVRTFVQLYGHSIVTWKSLAGCILDSSPTIKWHDPSAFWMSFFFCLLLLEAWTRRKVEWDSVSFSLIWVQPCIYVVSFVHAGFHLPYQVHDHQGPSTCILRRVDFSSLTLTWLKHLWFMLVRIIALPEIF